VTRDKLLHFPSPVITGRWVAYVYFGRLASKKFPLLLMGPDFLFQFSTNTAKARLSHFSATREHCVFAALTFSCFLAIMLVMKY
jgi:hypothetical protein